MSCDTIVIIDTMNLKNKRIKDAFNYFYTMINLKNPVVTFTIVLKMFLFSSRILIVGI